METIYQVANNLYTLKIKPIEVVKKNSSFYWTESNRRHALNTTTYQSFDKIEDAIEYMESVIKRNIMHSESSLAYYKSILKKFGKLYQTQKKDSVTISDTAPDEFWYSSMKGKTFKVKPMYNSAKYDMVGFENYDSDECWLVAEGEFINYGIVKKHCI